MIDIYMAEILSFSKDPTKNKLTSNAMNYYKNGLLIIENGFIIDAGNYDDIKEEYKINDSDINKIFKDKLIMPGFIDTHIHYAQTEIIGSFGEELLPWLEKYTFPAELKFKDKEYASKISDFFIHELLKNGTTTALVLGTVHEESIDAIFEVANSIDMRLIAGKVMMDRNAPKELLDTPKDSYEKSELLIKKWHEKNRLLYAVTPRFAPTSSNEQLKLAGELKKKYPTTYVHTHLSENKKEIDWVKSLFPESKSYLDVYDSFGLVDKRSIFAHAIHLEDEEYQTLYDKGAAISFCPTSNLFLGSGLFKIREMKKENRNIKIGLGTDVGAGTSFSMIKTLADAYKVISLEQNNNTKREAFGSFEAFYQATLGAAQSLYLDDKIGKIEKGYEADFIVIDFKPDALQNLRINKIEESKKSDLEKLEEKLFALMIMGDDRNIISTFINGKKVY